MALEHVETLTKQTLLASARRTYTPDDHLSEVINKTWNFSGRLETKKDEVLNAVLGLGGEAGEVVDLHKKKYYHTYKPDREQELLAELGDVSYYLLKILDLYGWTLEDALLNNREKLMKRYKEFFPEVSKDV